MSKMNCRGNKSRLSRRNTVDTLNDVLRAFNQVLTEDKQLTPVKTPADLIALRQKLSARSQEKGVLLEGTKSSTPEVEVLPNSMIQPISTIATNAWRARNRMMNSENGEAKEEMKRIVRHIEAVFDALNQIGVEIRDMQGRPYDSGMALKVVSFEPTPGLSKEEVSETIKPTITWKGKLIQMGEVIVGTPQTT